jgi:hypothetical protein
LSVVHRPDRAGAIWHFDAPASAGSAGYISHGSLAGLRLGLLSTDDVHEAFLDGGVTTGRRGDNGNDGVRVTANYQFNFYRTGHRLTPYVTAGAGIEHAGLALEQQLSPTETRVTSYRANVMTYGAGGGAQFRIPNGHGALRAEVRWDWTDGAEDQGVPLFARNTAVAVKLGFDVWM